MVHERGHHQRQSFLLFCNDSTSLREMDASPLSKNPNSRMASYWKCIYYFHTFYLLLWSSAGLVTKTQWNISKHFQNTLFIQSVWIMEVVYHLLLKKKINIHAHDQLTSFTFDHHDITVTVFSPALPSWLSPFHCLCWNVLRNWSLH